MVLGYRTGKYVLFYIRSKIMNKSCCYYSCYYYICYVIKSKAL